ncbi:MAG: serine hydrolase [Gaiellaceae bacterium]
MNSTGPPIETQRLGEALGAGEFAAVTSVLVARGGDVLLELYTDAGAAAGELRNTRSVTKTITGMLIGIAVERRHIGDVTARVFDLLPARRRSLRRWDERKAAITIEDFLTMSSCLDCDDWNSASPGNEERMYVTGDWVRFALELPVRSLPEKKRRSFRYCTGGVTVLGEVLEVATGQSVPEFAHATLFGPLGIEAVRWPFSPRGLAHTGGGLELRTRDLFRLGQLYLQAGKWRATQVVPRAWVARSLQAHVAVDDSTSYGYLWWLVTYRLGSGDVQAYTMSGMGGNRVTLFPAFDAVVVVTTTNYRLPNAHALTDRLLTEHVLPLLAGTA